MTPSSVNVGKATAVILNPEPGPEPPTRDDGEVGRSDTKRKKEIQLQLKKMKELQ